MQFCGMHGAVDGVDGVDVAYDAPQPPTPHRHTTESTARHGGQGIACPCVGPVNTSTD